MKAFEYYKEAKPEHAGNQSEIEQLQSMFLQAGLAEFKSRDLENHDQAEQEFVLHLGDWFRKNVLESSEEINGKSRKEYFLSLFDSDPEHAVEELDRLFKGSLH